MEKKLSWQRNGNVVRNRCRCQTQWLIGYGNSNWNRNGLFDDGLNTRSLEQMNRNHNHNPFGDGLNTQSLEQMNRNHNAVSKFKLDNCQMTTQTNATTNTTITTTDSSQEFRFRLKFDLTLFTHGHRGNMNIAPHIMTATTQTTMSTLTTLRVRNIFTSLTMEIWRLP